MILTGVTGGESSDPKNVALGDVPSILPWSGGEVIKYEREKYDDMTSHEILGKDLANTGKWVAFLKIEGVRDALDRATRVEMFDAIFTKNGLDPTVKTIMMAWVGSRYQGKRGKGIYAPHQLDYYKRIKAALANKKFVAVGTKEKVSKTEEGKGHSGGESMSKGLVGSHAYTIVAVRHDQNTGRRWLRIRNPWGDEGGGYGRAYEEKEGGILGAVKTKSAEFDLELSELTKRFGSVYISG